MCLLLPNENHAIQNLRTKYGRERYSEHQQGNGKNRELAALRKIVTILKVL